jgi:uncharacterized GH25 family protein
MKKFLRMILIANLAFSHDYWLQPKKFHLSKGETLDCIFIIKSKRAKNTKDVEEISTPSLLFRSTN